MMTSKITIMALIAGIVLGTAATEGFNVYRQSHDSQIFQERARCKTAADAYVKENTDLNDNSVTGMSVTVEKVDYSPGRNSCIAELNTTIFAPGTAYESYSVRDLLSGENIVSNACTKDCEFLRLNLVNTEFDYIMNNASIPMDVDL
jgi:ribosomal protein L2